MGSLKLQSFEDFAHGAKKLANAKLEEEQSAARNVAADQFKNLLGEFGVTSIKELKEEIPEKLNTPSIQARISVLETCFFKLEGIKDLKNIDKKTILSFIKEVLISHSNLILQINKKLEQESQKIEKP